MWWWTGHNPDRVPFSAARIPLPAECKPLITAPTPPARGLTRQDKLLVLGIIAVLACTLALVVAPRPAALAEVLPAGRSQADQPFHGLVVLQPQDCLSSVEFLRVVQRPEIRRAVQVEAVVIGSRAAADSAGALLDALGISMRVHQGDGRTLAALASLGHRSTPILVVLDRTRAVRLASASPSSAGDYRALLRSLRALAEPEP